MDRKQLLEGLQGAPGRKTTVDLDGFVVGVREPRFALMASFSDGYEEAEVDENEPGFEYEDDFTRMARVVIDTAFVIKTEEDLFESIDELEKLAGSHVTRLFETAIGLVNTPVEQADKVAAGKEPGVGAVPELANAS